MHKILLYLLVATIIISMCIASVEPVFGISADSWEKQKPMSFARGGLGVAVVDGKIYAIGGDAREGKTPYTGSIVGINEEYDPKTDTWTTKASMPTPRSSFAIAAYQGKIYCFGGISSVDQVTWHITDSVEMYNPTADAWENRTSMPTARRELQANLVNDKIYLIGGYIGASDHPSTENAVYDPATDSWANATSMPIAGGQFHSCVLDDKIHFVAFSEINSATPLHLVYDPVGDNWTQAKADPLAPSFSTAAATTGINASKRIYTFGKTSALSESSTRTRIYNPYTRTYVPGSLPDTDYWEYGASMPSNRIDFAVANVNDTFYAIGGYTRKLDYLYDTITLFATNERYFPPDYGKPDPQYNTPPQPSNTPKPTTNPSGGLTDPTASLPLIVTVTVIIIVVICVITLALRKLPKTQRIKVPLKKITKQTLTFFTFQNSYLSNYKRKTR